MNKISVELEQELISNCEKQSLQELENITELATVKKKYLGKDGLILQFLQQLVQEKDLEKRKKLGVLINN